LDCFWRWLDGGGFDIGLPGVLREFVFGSAGLGVGGGMKRREADEKPPGSAESQRRLVHLG
jgi:hypothetical protein